MPECISQIERKRFSMFTENAVQEEFFSCESKKRGKDAGKITIRADEKTDIKEIKKEKEYISKNRKKIFSSFVGIGAFHRSIKLCICGQRFNTKCEWFFVYTLGWPCCLFKVCI